MKKSTLWAAVTMFGGIIGAGIFGVPFVFAKTGVLTGLAYVVFIGAAAALINAYYVIVVSETAGRHRLAGYTRKYFGRSAARLVAVISFFEFFGAMLVYIILGGNFLAVILGGTAGFWSVVFVAVGALVLLLPLKKSEVVDRFFTLGLMVVVVAIVFLVAPQVRYVNLVTLTPENWFVPYGVIFFALSGSAIIPEIVEVLRKDEQTSMRAVIGGTLAAAALVGLFGTIIVGVCGLGTTQDAIGGLAQSFGRPIVILGSLFGLAAVATQFVVVGSNIRDEFIYDFKVKHLVGWGLAVGVPLTAFALGARDFVGIIGFLGAVLGAAVGVTIIFIGRRVMDSNKKHASLRRFAIPLMILFVTGLVAEIISLIK